MQVKLETGTRVEVPGRKPRGREREYHAGTVVEVSASNIVTVDLDEGRRVHAPIGLVHKLARP